MTRSNLQLANEQRDYRIFEEFAYSNWPLVERDKEQIFCND